VPDESFLLSTIFSGVFPSPSCSSLDAGVDGAGVLEATVVVSSFSLCNSARKAGSLALS